MSLSKSRRVTAVTIAAAAVSLASAAPASAATPISCPAAACQRLANGLGEGIGVAHDGVGTAYVSYQSGQLRKVNLSTGASSVLASGLGNLRGVAADTTGVYVADFNGSVSRVDAVTGAQQRIATGLGHLQGLARSAGTTYTVGDGSLWQIGSTTRVVATGLGMAMDVVVDGNRALVADLTGSVRQVDLATGTVQTVVSGFYEPTHIGVTNDGAVYFLEAGLLLHRIEPGTNRERTIGELRGVTAMDFALDRTGKALITDLSGGGRLWQLTI